jgi:NAD(P)-dependent dehydrogenase (short-subunit alcohol dehydrogenase family)
LRTPKEQGVLITGASRGIGKRLALGFAALGYPIGLLARSQPELDLAKLEIEHAGGQALTLRADVRDYREISLAVAKMDDVFGGVHILIAAAAVQGPIGPFWTNDPCGWKETIEINLLGVIHVCHAVLPQMLSRRSGKILLLSGGGSAYARPNFSAYGASKTAVVRLAEVLAEEARDHNVQVNCMAPGGSYTHMTDEILHAGELAGNKEIDDAEKVRLTGGTSPEKQLQLALFLTSERSNHISGKLIHVNDDWKRLENENAHPEVYTLRRLQKISS